MLTGIGGEMPAIRPEQIRQIGIRSVDEGEKRFLHDLCVEVFDMRYIDEIGMRATMEQALAGVDQDTHLHVSLDVDFPSTRRSPQASAPRCAADRPTARPSCAWR